MTFEREQKLFCWQIGAGLTLTDLPQESATSPRAEDAPHDALMRWADDGGLVKDSDTEAESGCANA